MLPNEVFALECIARYAREGLDVKEGGVHDGYPDEFAHCPKPRPKGQKWRLAGDLGYWLTFYDHQKQGLLQSIDVGRQCYFAPSVLLYLNTWPSGCFELWDIYDKFNKRTEEHKKNIGEALRGKYCGEKAPNYGKFGAAHNNSKAIIVIKPDGTEWHYGSSIEAAQDLGIKPGNLCNWLKDSYVPIKGKFEGHQFFYAVKE